ncbi:MAG: CRISPR-associated protein Cmr1 [Actinomycetota bacterium]|nr:CRISPR-associated protein Cmr1 [Actinomycetota bacterium]
MAGLRSLDVELEAVTPLWIGGADARAELRPPSVRGCLRFWFRALAGGLLGERLGDIWEAESAVYGNTTRASTVVVRLLGSPRTGVSVAGEAQQLPGLGYMFWSVFQQKRDAILPGERFRLRLHTRPFPFDAVEVGGRKLEMSDSFELAAASLWLLLRLGGVGARVRRGAGGMRAVAEPEGWPTNLPALASDATTPAELALDLSEGIKRVRQAAGWQAQPPADPSSYDILHERVCELYLADITFPSWWEAVNWAGEKFRAFRIEVKLDASGVAALLTQGRLTVRTIQRAMLGLPITFFFKSIFADLTGRGVDTREARRKASATVMPSRGLGRASPLFFRVVPLAGAPATYGVLMGLFRSRLLPDHEMTVKPGDFSLRPARAEVPSDFSVIERWFDHVRAQEVGLLPVALR